MTRLLVAGLLLAALGVARSSRSDVVALPDMPPQRLDASEAAVLQGLPPFRVALALCLSDIRCSNSTFMRVLSSGIRISSRSGAPPAKTRLTSTCRFEISSIAMSTLLSRRASVWQPATMTLWTRLVGFSGG